MKREETNCNNSPFFINSLFDPGSPSPNTVTAGPYDVCLHCTMAAAVSYSQWKTGWVPGARPSPCKYSAALHCPVYWLSLVTHLWLQQGEALTDFIGWRLIRVRPIFRADASCGADNQEAVSLVCGCSWAKCCSLEEISRKVLRIFGQDRTHSSEYSQNYKSSIGL